MRPTLYRFVGPKGELRADGTKLLKRKGQTSQLMTEEETNNRGLIHGPHLGLKVTRTFRHKGMSAQTSAIA